MSLVFTERRVIVAAITQELGKVETKKVKETARAEGKGLFWQMAASVLPSGRSFGKRYAAMAPSAVLGESRGNSDIPFDSIHRASLKER